MVLRTANSNQLLTINNKFGYLAIYSTHTECWFRIHTNVALYDTDILIWQDYLVLPVPQFEVKSTFLDFE